MPKKGACDQLRLWVPAERLLAVFDQYPGSLESLSQRTSRKIRLLRCGSQGYVSLNVVDEMLVEMDLVEWLMLPADQGGLADIYFDGKQYGKPEPARHTFRYASEEERIEARRASWRRQAAKKKQPQKVEVRCPRCSRVREVGKYYARRIKPGSVCAACVGEDVRRAWDEHKAHEMMAA